MALSLNRSSKIHFKSWSQTPVKMRHCNWLSTWSESMQMNAMLDCGWDKDRRELSRRDERRREAFSRLYTELNAAFWSRFHFGLNTTTPGTQFIELAYSIIWRFYYGIEMDRKVIVITPLPWDAWRPEFERMDRLGDRHKYKPERTRAHYCLCYRVWTGKVMKKIVS